MGPFDISFLENGAYNQDWKNIHQLPEEAVQASIDLRSKKMVPIHWGMFDLALHSWFDPIERVTREAREKNVSIITPRLGQIVSVKKQHTQDYWWREIISQTVIIQN